MSDLDIILPGGRFVVLSNADGSWTAFLADDEGNESDPDPVFEGSWENLKIFLETY